MKNLFLWREKLERERARRIKLSIAAFAYEFEHETIIPDHEFDLESRLVDTSLDTGNKVLDSFFRENFDPSTGNWIWKHPELDKIRYLYFKYYKKQKSQNVIKWS